MSHFSLRLGGMLVPLFLWMAWLPCSAQPAATWFRHLSIEEGLASTYVTRIFQDSKGFMWIGTWKGLCRYDGYDFKVYRHDPGDSLSISESGIYTTLEDQYGNLWTGTANGLNRFDRTTETFRRYLNDPPDPASPGKNSVSALVVTPDGQLWAGTQSGLHRYDRQRDRFVRFKLEPDTAKDQRNLVLALCASRDSHLWIGTNNGLYRLHTRTGRIEHFAAPADQPLSGKTLSGNYIYALKESPEGLLYITSRGAVDIYDPADPAGPFLHPAKVSVPLWWDQQNHVVWYANATSLYRRLPSGVTEDVALLYRPGDPEGLGSRTITSFYQDREGTIWIGTDNGLNVLTKEAFQFRHFRHNAEDPNSLSKNSLSCVAEGRDGSIWIGTKGGGLNRLNLADGSVRRYPFDQPGTAHSANSSSIFSLYEDRSGTLWIGYFYGGLDRLDVRTGIFRHKQWNDGYRTIVSWIYESRANEIWLGHHGGLSRYNPVTDDLDFITYAPEKKGQGGLGVVTGITEDSFGAWWVASNHYYLNRFYPESGKFERYLPNPASFGSPASNNIQAIYVDQKGQLWVGTDKGLDQFQRDKGTFRHFGLEHGLPDLMMGHMLEDGRDRLWIATGKGITCFDPATETFRNFDKADGLSSNESWDFVKSPTTGAFYLATANGLTVFHPDSLQDNPVAPPVVFTHCTKVDHRTGKVEEVKGVTELQELTFSWQDDVLTFEFTALSFRKPSKNQYAYQLEGMHEQWVPLGAKREVTFTNLAPGNYTLRVKGSNGDGVWNENGASIRIRVLPPWWQSWWAYLFYTFIIGASVTGVYRFQLRRKLEHKEAERLKELDAVKTRFYTNVTHEFRTPLTVIGGMAEKINENPSKWLPEGIDMIRRNTANLLRLVNQMLELSKLEAGVLPVHLTRGDIILYLRYLGESFHSYAASRLVELAIRTDINRYPAEYDPEKIEQIVSNLLTNAIRFTPEGGSVVLATGLMHSENTSGVRMEGLSISVRDTGTGIPEEQMPYIFDRFYQSGDTAAARPPGWDDTGGAGIGLALTRELARLLGGWITAANAPDGGALFTVWLPMQRLETLETPVMATAPQVLQENDNTKVSVAQLLLVEDNADVVRYLAACLADHYRLLFASDGVAGLEMALTHTPDLIVSDVMMPQMDGFEFCARLRQDSRTSHIPIVLLTAKGDTDSRLTGLRQGAEAYLVKPFHPEELRIVVQNLLDMRRSLQVYYRALAAGQGKPDKGAGENAFVLEVRRIVEEHLADPAFDVEKLCRAIGMSSSQLHRKLTALTGLPSNRFIRFIRLGRACTLLKDPSNHVADVAYACGFQDPVYFARVFRQEFNQTPTEWRTKQPSKGP